MFTASLSSLIHQNGKTSGNDLADLSKNRPSQKYAIWTRARVNFRVRRHFLRFVAFSKIAPSFRPRFGTNARFSETRK